MLTITAGLLACLALRYDASRSIDMRARATAAADAINSALAALDKNATSTQIANSAAAAAEAAFDRVADREGSQRDASVQEDGRTPGSSGHNGSSAEQGADLQRVPASDAVLVQRNYFTPVMAAYVLGLVTAFAANSITHLGQPALLYIVPATLSAVGLTAVRRNEVRRIWAFTDVPTFGALEALKEQERASKEQQ